MLRTYTTKPEFFDHLNQSNNIKNTNVFKIIESIKKDGDKALSRLTEKYDKVKISNSFPIGSVRLLQNKVNKYSWDNMRSWIEENSSGLVIDKAIGSGGNINKMASILGKKKGQYLSYASIKRELKKIKVTNLRYRIVELGMRPDRADVIEHASKIYLKCMKWSGARKILVPQSGLADGLIEQLYKKYKLNV